MNRILFSISIIFILSLNSCTSKTAGKEAARNDSIKKYLELAGNGDLDSKTRKKYNDKALEILDISRNDTLARFFLGSISANCIRIKDFEKYKKVSKYHYEKAVQSKDTLNLMRYYWYKGVSYTAHKINDSAFYCFIKAEELHKKNKQDISLGNIKLNKGITQFRIGDYSGAEISLITAYKIYDKKNEKELIYQALNQLGLTYNELGDYKKSLYYHMKALETINKDEIDDKDLKKTVCYNNIGYLYLNQKKYQKAVRNFEMGLKYKNLIVEDIELYALLKSNLAYTRFKMKDFAKVPKLLEEALRFKGRLKSMQVLTNLYAHYAEYYEQVGKHSLAIKYCDKSLREAESSKKSAGLLVSLYVEALINKEKTAEYLEKYTKIVNDFQIEERKSRDRFDKIKFDTAEITQEKENAIKQRWVVSITSIIIILLVLIILVITNQQSKEKEIQLLKRQQKANEEIYTLLLIQNDREDEARRSEKIRIAQELHDGVMNRLSSTRLNLDILKYKNDEETIKKCLPHIEELYQIEQEIRNISHDLNIEAFTNSNSFVALLDNLISKLNEISSTRYSIEMSQDLFWNIISSNTKINIYRIIQESCSNINKFAKAQNATISLTLDENNLCLSITDDGQGFDTETKSAGIGLKNIEQRVEMLNGDFFIQSIKNKSTSINIAIPIL